MHQNKQDHEAKMAKSELLQIAKNAVAIMRVIHEGDELPGWVSSYITLANDHLNSVQEHMEYEKSAAAAVDIGPREFEESVKYNIKANLVEQYLQKKYQG
jgi:hypothetical protein